MSDQINIVIVHIGYREYLKTNLEITGKKNKIYLIGDDSIKMLGNISNVTFIDINKYINCENIVKYKKSFTNYSSNGKDFEFMCFARIFVIKLFLIEYNLKRIFHIDSDNILLKNINDYIFNEDNAYFLNADFHKNRMSNSVHCGLLSIDFCNKFEELYKDIYINKSKLNLIQDKITEHTDNSGKYINGGICDMTLYYLLNTLGLVKVQNLGKPTLIGDKKYVFMNNINNGEGFDSKQQYKLENNLIKLFKSKNMHDMLIYDIINKETYIVLNIHFQGNAKRLLNSDLANLIIF